MEAFNDKREDDEESPNVDTALSLWERFIDTEEWWKNIVYKEPPMINNTNV